MLRYEGMSIQVVKVPDKGTMGESIGMQCHTRSHAAKDGGSFETHTLMVRKSDAGKWHKDPMVQMMILHEIAHAHINAFKAPAVERSHFLTEFGATVWGYVRFRHLAPLVKRRHLARKVVESWLYYTREVGFSVGELLAMEVAYVTGFIFGLAVCGRIWWPIGAVYACIMAFVAWKQGVISDKIAKKRGMKSFRLKGIW